MSNGREAAAGVTPKTVAPGRELRQRVASGLVLAPAALLAAWAEAPIFAAAVAAGGVILAREWTRMADPEGGDAAFALAAAGAAGAAIAASAGLVGAAMAWALALAAAAAIEAKRRGRWLEAGFGVLYIAVPAVLILHVRLLGEPVGAQLVTFVFVAVWGADIGAYAAGRVFGGPRLPEWISPSKTYVGLLGGLALAVAFGGALAALVGWVASPSAGLAWVVFAAVTGAAALFGDLFESAAKRRFGVKDAGALIPGHGGLLDRLDSLLVAVVVFAGLVHLRGAP